MSKYLIVGAGLSGLTAARILKDKGHDILVLEKNHLIGGTCADYAHDGYFIGTHGPHLFHTDDEQVWGFLSRFTDWLPYQHRVYAVTDKGVIPVPFNDISADIVGELDETGIVDLLFRNYSRKMWGLEWEQLPEFVTSRVPRRKLGRSCRYFDVKYEGLPRAGYSSMLTRMAEGIDVRLGVPESEWKRVGTGFDRVIYCGRPDAISNYLDGRLRFRSLRFGVQWGGSLGVDACILNNCTSSGPIRTIDYSAMYGVKRAMVPLVSEYPGDAEGEPYYPMWDTECFEKIRQRVEVNGLSLLGRVATYKYMDMDQAVRKAMNLVEGW